MRTARNFFRFVTKATISLGLFVYAAPAAAFPPDTANSAALVFPDLNASLVGETLWIKGENPIAAWPVSVRNLCRETRTAMDADSAITTTPETWCGGTEPQHWFHLTSSIGGYALERRYPLGDAFEVFRGGWESKRVSAEQGETWNQIPPAINLEFNHNFSPSAHLFFQFGLRRDISAWHQDPLGGNLPLSSKEVDLNQPMRGYFHAQNSWAEFTLGRFPVHWSPSPEYGLTLSGDVPYHNGALFSLTMARVHYRLLVSSLNPWLQGSPGGDSANADYPVGSEEWLQRHYAGSLTDNAHLRVYDARIKTLIAHRLELAWNPASIGLTELCMIGGKVPDLRDMSPFGFYHNDFKDGFANTSLSGDAKVRLPMGFAVLGELILDDVRYTPTESSSSGTVLGWLGGLEQVWGWRRFRVFQSLNVIRTDPLLYRYPQPYNTLYSRIVLTSNNQGSKDQPFVDKYVVDYPLGYARGGGAMDYRYAARWMDLRNQALLRLDYLTQEGASLEIPYAALADGTANLKPYQSEEWRAEISGSRRYAHGLAVQAGLGWNLLSYPARNPRERSQHVEGDVGISWSFSAGK